MTGGNSSQIRIPGPLSGDLAPSDSTNSCESPLAASNVTVSAEGAQPAAGAIEGSVVASSIAELPANFDSEQTVISKSAPGAASFSLAHLPPVEMGRLLAGTRLGHYQLQEFVGGGGMGAVFRAHDTMLDRVVAVKVLSKTQSNDEETLRRFKNEAQSAARLDHENIGRVHYVGEDQGWHYIVFEFIEGINLRDLVDRDGPLSLADAVSYTLQVADALAHASQRDVVHRDIKPSNVLIAPGGRVKLVDMGLARLHQVEHSGDDLTASGVTLGTFDYISPEQARDPRNADVRSDIYSLGCTLYFMLTRRPPFPDGTVLQKLLQHQAEEPADAQAMRPDLPDELFKILRRMLAKSPAQRYQTPQALIRDLLALATQYDLPALATSSALFADHALGRSGWARHIPWAAPMALLLLIAALLAFINRSGGADERPPPIRHASIDANHRSSATEPAPIPGPPSGSSRQRSGSSAARATNPSKAAGDSPSTDRVVERDQGTIGSSASTAGKSAATSRPIGPEQIGFDSQRSPSAASIVLAPADHSAPFDLRSWLRRRIARSYSLAPEDGSKRLGPSVDAGPTPPDTSLAGAAEANATPPAERKGVLVVSGIRRGPAEYASLAEACRAAKSGDVVELRYNGRLPSRPMNLAGQRLTIRAADGYSPIVSFEPRSSDLAQSSSMMSFGGGQFTALGVQFEIRLKNDLVSESWTLAEIRPGESVRLDGCTLTIKNSSDEGAAYAPDVAFFDIRAVPGPGVMTASDTAPARLPASLVLKNSVVRGEALFARADEPLPIQINWENGLLAITQKLLTVRGGPSDPKPAGQMQITLQHVTAYVPEGLVQLVSTSDAPLLPPLEINASDCIFSGKTEPFIDQTGPEEPEELRRRLAWTGDRNFYEGFDCWWRIGGPGSAEPALKMNFADWQAFWAAHEIQPTANQVKWRNSQPSERHGPHRQQPADYTLLGAGDNPAHNSASDGHDAGMLIDLLPALDDGN